MFCCDRHRPSRGPAGAGPRGRSRCPRPSPPSATPLRSRGRRHGHRSRVVAVDAEDARATSLRPDADEPGERDDLARRAPRSEMSRNTPSRVRCSTLRTRLAGPLALAPLRAARSRRPTIARTRSSAVSPARRSREDVPAVAHDRHPLADLEDLLQPVRDEEHRRAALAQRLDHAEQPRRPRRPTAPRSARPSRSPWRRATAPWRSRRSADRRSTGRGRPVGVERARRAARTSPRTCAAHRARGRCARRERSGWRPMKTFSATVRSGKSVGSW